MVDVTLERVSKRYWIKYRRARARRFSLLERRQELWAVKDLSFQVARGECLGIVGHNGAGKSTILKLLSGITAPTSGQITIRGRLSAMVELSAGFQADLTGRENIFLSGSILGMTRREIASRVERIVEFSGISDFIDSPLKRYSSGMSVRLGFSIAAHVQPHILILDEVLAVGDAAFQARCLDRIEELQNEGTTIVFASHDLAALERLSDRALLLEHGKLMMSDTPKKVIEEYLSKTFSTGVSTVRGKADMLSAVQCVSLEFLNPEGDCIRTGAPLIARVMFTAAAEIRQVTITLSLYWPSGYLCCELTSSGRIENMALHAGTGTLEFFCPQLVMQRGLYTADITIEREGDVIAHYPRCSQLRVDPGIPLLGDFYQDHRVELVPSVRANERAGAGGATTSNCPARGSD